MTTLKHNWLDWIINDLQRSSIDIPTAESYGLYPSDDGQSYCIPYFDPVTGKLMLDAEEQPYIRRRMLSGPHKYLSNINAGIRCYIPKKTHEFYTINGQTPLLITEGEKKVICSTEKGIPAIGIGGITMWRKCNGSNNIHPDILQYLKTRNEVILVYDSDGLHNSNFKRNTERLAISLHELGVKLCVVYLPKLSKAKTGLDDFLLRFDKSEAINYLDWNKNLVKPNYQTQTYGRVFFDALQEHNINATDYLIVGMIQGLSKYKDGNKIRQWIAERLNLSRQTVHNRLKALSLKGFISIRKESRRSAPIMLAEKGVKLFRKQGLY